LAFKTYIYFLQSSNEKKCLINKIDLTLLLLVQSRQPLGLGIDK